MFRLSRRLPNKESVYIIACSPKGDAIATGGQDSLIRIHSTDPAVSTYGLETDDSWINSIAFSPDSQSLAAAGAGTVLRLFDLATRQVTREIEGNDDCIYCLAFSPDGK